MRKKKQKKAKQAKSAKKAAAKKAPRKVARLAAAKKTNGNGLPKISSKPYGKDGKALTGVRILDFTHVQSGPTCTQLLAWFGADVIKVERPGVGDITRGQLVDVKGADSLYFTMLNHNKRSITIDSKNPQGMRVLEALIKTCDVLVENFAPGALDRMGLTWEHINKINPRMIVASIKGFGPGPYEDCKVYENVAQCAGGSASTTGFRDGPPLVTGAQIGDSGTGLHLALGIAAALFQRTRTGRGQKVDVAMQDGVLNLCRVKLRDQQRLKAGPLAEYSQYGEGIPFGDATPRAGNDSGGGQPGWILKCRGAPEDPNAYIYFITQAPVWGPICDLIGEPTWKTDPEYATPRARLPKLKAIFARIEAWTMTKTKFEVMEACNAVDIPVGPILSMKEIAEEPSLRKTRTVVEVDHPTRGKYLTVGNPIKLSDSISEVKRSPLLGEHTDEILTDVLGFKAGAIAEIKNSGALSAPKKEEKAA
ncbi:MAG TPA: formyl-CoA transferase [Pseudolabrys sp.]|jgi:formyl-CoA transferase|nr:formyl-CoA transferase [Pseudolabrys sp.]